MQINQQLVRFNQVLIIKEINKKVLKVLGVHKPLFTKHKLLFSEHKPSIDRLKITLKLKKKLTELKLRLRLKLITRN